MITLQQNVRNYRFQTTLFPSILQGDKALVSIPHLLAGIAKRQHEFDCVVIVRGGGGDVGMSCYDHYSLAAAIATFPLPVITGIGHSTNETVTDMVAFANKITPTEVAYFLIQQFHNFETKVEECRNYLIKRVKDLLREKDFYFSKIQQQLVFIVGKYNQQKEKGIELMSQRLQSEACQLLLRQQNILQHLQMKIELLHPDNILQRGYSITMKNDRPVRNAEEVNKGDILTTRLFQGEIQSVVMY
jgi:exodeoxyribonuclease VII large subunit